MTTERYCRTCMRIVHPDASGRCRSCKKSTIALSKGWPEGRLRLSRARQQDDFNSYKRPDVSGRKTAG